MTNSKKDIKQQRAALLGMPYGTAEKHLRKAMLHTLAQQCGKNVCRWCRTPIESPSDLAVVHIQDWAGDAALFWDLNNVAFSHVSCAAERGGIQQEDHMERLKVIIEDNHGNALPGTNHKGQIYVAGQKDQRYNLRITNTTGKRVIAVITVDGRNVLSGKKGTFGDRGYVLSAYQTAVIDGWRQTDETVAAFVFGSKEGAYSTEMGSPENVGVIGVAVFEEKQPAPITIGSPFVIHTHHHHYPWQTSRPYPTAYPTSDVWLGGVDIRGSGIAPMSDTPIGGNGSFGGGGTFSAASVHVPNPGQGEPPTLTLSSVVSDSLRTETKTTAKIPQQLGTQYGDTIASHTTTVSFVRATTSPCELHTIRYDSMEALKAAGVMGDQAPSKSKAPEAFPDEPRVTPGYCQVPLSKRG